MLIKILFEFHHFFKLQNVIISQIHFNTTSTGRRGDWGGLIFRGCIFFCLQVDSSDISKGGPWGVCPPPPPSQGLDPALDRSIKGGGGGLILEVYCS